MLSCLGGMTPIWRLRSFTTSLRNTICSQAVFLVDGFGYLTVLS